MFVEDLLKASGVVLSHGGGFEGLRQFQDYLPDYQIIVFDGLNKDRKCLAENHVRPRNYIYYKIGTISTTT